LYKLKTTSAPAETKITRAETNSHSASSTSVNSAVSKKNKKLRLLEDLYSDDDYDDAGESGSGDDKTSFRMFQEVAAYLGPIVLTEEENVGFALLETSLLLHIPISVKLQKYT